MLLHRLSLIESETLYACVFPWTTSGALCHSLLLYDTCKTLGLCIAGYAVRLVK